MAYAHRTHLHAYPNPVHALSELAGFAGLRAGGLTVLSERLGVLPEQSSDNHSGLVVVAGAGQRRHEAKDK